MIFLVTGIVQFPDLFLFYFDWLYLGCTLKRIFVLCTKELLLRLPVELFLYRNDFTIVSFINALFFISFRRGCDLSTTLIYAWSDSDCWTNRIMLGNYCYCFTSPHKNDLNSLRLPLHSRTEAYQVIFQLSHCFGK